MRLICAGLIATTLACSGDPGDGPDPVDGGVDDDGGSGGDQTALEVDLTPSPAVGESFTSPFAPVLSSVAVDVSDFRAVGDVAASDNLRVASLELTFVALERVIFSDIPVGRYTRTRGRVDRYQLSGTCVVGGETVNWAIDDTPAGGIDVTSDFDALDIGAGETGRVEHVIELHRVFDAVDWNAVTPDGDTLRIDGNSPEIGAVRDAVREAFEEGESDSDPDSD